MGGAVCGGAGDIIVELSAQEWGILRPRRGVNPHGKERGRGDRREGEQRVRAALESVTGGDLDSWAARLSTSDLLTA